VRYRRSSFVRICGHWQEKAENQNYESLHEILNAAMNADRAGCMKALRIGTA
jgi:hypothetical protein